MTHSIYSGMGYYRNDDRVSGGVLVEDDLLGCGHSGIRAQMTGCTPTMKRSEWKLAGGMCYICHAPLCVSCTQRALQFGCDGPEVGRIEEAVLRDYRRTQLEKSLGLERSPDHANLLRW